MSDQIQGEYFAAQPRGLLDVARCILGHHRAAMSGSLPSGSLVERCTCGASRYCGGSWLHDGHPLRLVSRARSVRLIAADHGRQRNMVAEITRIEDVLDRTREAS